MITIKLMALNEVGCLTMDKINSKNNSYINRTKLKIAKAMIKPLMSYSEDYDSKNHILITTFDKDISIDQIDKIRLSLNSLMLNNGASSSDYDIEVSYG